MGSKFRTAQGIIRNSSTCGAVSDIQRVNPAIGRAVLHRSTPETTYKAHGTAFAWLKLAADVSAEGGTLNISITRPFGRECRVLKLSGLLASVLATLFLSGCATQAADPVQSESVQVPDSEDTATKSVSGDVDPNVIKGDSGDVDPNVISVDPNVVSYDDYNDPLMPFNRFVFGFNDIVGRYALIPLGKGYAKFVPEPVDKRIDNFFDNVESPISAANNLFQGEFRASGRSLARFGINTTIGLLGLFDPAESWFGLQRAETDFAATLAHYNAGYGAYLVLPFLGPSDTRNATARVVDYFMNPIPYVLDNPESFMVVSYGFFHDFAQNAEDYEKLIEQSEDPYIFMRNLHLQGIQRDAAYRR